MGKEHHQNMHTYVNRGMHVNIKEFALVIPHKAQKICLKKKKGGWGQNTLPQSGSNRYNSQSAFAGKYKRLTLAKHKTKC